MGSPGIKPRFWWIVDQFALSGVIKKIAPDIYVSLDTNLPLLTSFNKRLKTVVTIHDIIPIVLKDEYCLPPDRASERCIKFAAAKRASRIITISQFSKRDIIKNLKIDSDKINCIYESTDSSFQKPSQSKIDLSVKEFVGESEYIMTVGDYYGVDPRKNYIFLVESFANFLSAKQNSGIKLLFVGKSGGKDNEYSKILSKARELGIEDKISFSGFVSDEQLAALYAGARAFVYPTKYEGFGLPILQAMSCGCPVVAANNTSLPEVAGEAAELFKTGDEKSFLRALDNVIGNRNKYERLGYENVKRFSWRKAAKEFVELIESL
jgi:glycosyltransferase involved in cell wall biosynthesis